MPQSVPNGWQPNTVYLNDFGGGNETPIQSRFKYNDTDFTVVTNSTGKWILYDSNSQQQVIITEANGSSATGDRFNNQAFKDQIGGNAGLEQLKSLSQTQVSQGLSQYLTEEEKNKLQNQKLDSSIQNVDKAAASTEEEPTIGGLTQLPSELFGKKENFGNLMYPKNMNSGQDRIFITQFQYKRTDVIQREGDFSTLRTKENIVGSVTLPIPNEVSETNSVGWGDNSLSNVAALSMPKLIEAGLKAGEGNIAGAVNDGFAAVRNTLMSGSAGRRLQQFLAVNAAASVVKKFGVNVDPEAFIVRSTGAAINPNLELLYFGPKLRQFGFQFKMTPRSKEEAIQIRKIIRFFKQGMSPRKGIGEASFFLGTPNVFKLQFKSGENELKSIGKIKTCALLSFAVNYTPDGFYAAYEDASANGSQPISVTMQLGFTELTPVFNDEFDDNYDDIGPNIFPKNNFNGFTDGAGNASTSGNEEEGRSGPPTPGTRTARG